MKRLLILIPFLLLGACSDANDDVKSRSGVGLADVSVTAGADGLTVEQRNIKKRVERDNKPGVMKYCYIQSGFSGEIIMFMTFDGKLSSSGKRLTPKTIVRRNAGGTVPNSQGIPIDIGGERCYTHEVMQDDGTYGSSSQYLYGFTTDDNRIDVYALGSNVMYVSEKPLRFPGVKIGLTIGTPEAG